MRFLIKHGVELAGREIARAVGLSQRITHATLMDLRGYGVVSLRRAGKAKLYKLNKTNIFVSTALRPLFAFEENLFEQLSALIVQKIKKQIISIIIFGSVATGNEKPNSDVDLLIILKEAANSQKAESTLDELSLLISKSFGNLLSPVLLKERQFCRRYKQKDEFIRSIVAHGKVIYGKTFMEIIYA